MLAMMIQSRKLWVVCAALSGAGLVLVLRATGWSSLATAGHRSMPSATCRSTTTFADGANPTSILHVAVEGSDTRGDGSAEGPFRTIARAARNVSAGTALYLHAGTYEGGTFLSGLRAEAAAPIWIMGAPGEQRPTIVGGEEGLHLAKPRYVVLQHLEVLGTSGSGINVDDGGEYANPDAARSVVFRDLYVHDTGRRPSGVPNCLKLAGLNDFFVLNSTFERCGNGTVSGAVGVGGVGVHHGIVVSNRLAANGYGGVQVKGGSDDIQIAGNVFHDTGWRAVMMGGSTGRPYFRPPLSRSTLNYEAARIHVSANIFTGSETAAVFSTCIDCEFTHNTVVDPSKWALRILNEAGRVEGYAFAGAANGLIAGNIFYFRRADLNAGEDINVGAHAETRSFYLSRNLWFAHDEPSQSDPRIPRFDGVHAESLTAMNPRFVGAAAGDFHLAPNSPARHRGNSSSVPIRDFAGECYATRPSLGALEVR
jgi:hypothetical protein